MPDAPYLACSLVGWNTMWFWVAEELVNSAAVIDHSNKLKPYMEVLIYRSYTYLLKNIQQKMALLQENGSRIKWFLKQNKYFFGHTCIHSTLGLGMHMTICNRLYSCHNMGIFSRPYWWLTVPWWIKLIISAFSNWNFNYVFGKYQYNFLIQIFLNVSNLQRRGIWIGW